MHFNEDYNKRMIHKMYLWFLDVPGSLAVKTAYVSFQESFDTLSVISA